MRIHGRPWAVFAMLLVMLAGAVPLFAESKSLFSFEEWEWDYPTGVGFWADAESRKPAYSRSDDVADGKSALKVEFFGCKKFQGINVGPLHLPPSARYITFQLKLLSGQMPSQIELEEKLPGAATPERFGISFAPPSPGRYRRVVLPLEKFRFLRGEGDRKLDITNPLILLLTGYTADGALFLIDDIRAESELPEEKESNQIEQSPAPLGINLLPGDCSFESGPGGWVFWESAYAPRIQTGDAADGSSALLLPPRHRLMTPMFYKLRDPASEYVFSFSAKSNGGGSVQLHLWGAHWQYLSGRLFQLSSEWKRYSLRIPAGKEQITDVRIHFHNGAHEMLLDSVQFEKGRSASAYAPSLPIASQFSTGYDGELLAENELPVRMRGRIHNASAMPRQITVNAKHGGRTFFSRRLHLAPYKVTTVEFDCPFAGSTGYYPIKVTLADAAGKLISENNTPFSVIPSIRPGDGFFGIQTDSLPAGVMKKAGIAVLRKHCSFWKGREPNGPIPGPYAVVPDPGTEKGIDWFCALAELNDVPAWARRPGSPLARPGSMQTYVKWALAVAGPYARYFDFQNEPDLTLMRIPGINRQKAVEYYCEMLRSISADIRSAGKKLAINTAGGGNWFAEQVFAEAGNCFDLYALHPYTFPRTFAVDGRSVANPENGGFLDQMHQARALIRKYGNRHELAIGELGWALERTAPPDSEAALRHAAVLSRTCLLARSFPECRFLIWYSGVGEPYGIWRDDNGTRPWPAVSAYCWAIASLDRGKDFKFLMKNDIRLIRWRTPEAEYAAIWVPEGFPKKITISVPGAECFDLLGSALPEKRFEINEFPRFIRSESLDEVLASVQKQIAEAAPLDLVIRHNRRHVLEVRAINSLPVPWRGKLLFRTLEQPLQLLAESEKKLEFVSSDIKSGFSGEVVAVSENGRRYHFPAKLPPYVSVPKIRIGDWRTFDFLKAAPLYELNSRQDVDPPDPFIHWTGPDDLSVKAFFGYDSENFYLMAEVTDDKHETPFEQGDIWQNDCIQFAFDTLNDGLPDHRGYAQDDYEFGGSEGHAAWCWSGRTNRQGPASIQSDIRRIGRKTVYRFAVPWRELQPLGPESGRIFGFAMAVQDRDDGVNNYRISFGRGIAEGKIPASFRKMMLE